MPLAHAQSHLWELLLPWWLAKPWFLLLTASSDFFLTWIESHSVPEPHTNQTEIQSPVYDMVQVDLEYKQILG